MAIYHFTTYTHSRGKGHSAVAAAAYRSNEVLIDERTGEKHDYRQYRKTHGEVLAAAIFLPGHASEEIRDRSTLWNGAEAAEKTKGGAYKKTAAIAREIEASLPHELSAEVREELARIHARYLVQRYGVAVDMALHAPDKGGDDRNYHVHYLLTTREINAQGFGGKCELELSGKKKKELGLASGQKQIKEMREAWARGVNRALERAGLEERVTEKSFEELGLDKIPSKHLGPAATQMKRRGEKSRIEEENITAALQNKKMEGLKTQQQILQQAIAKEAKRLAEERARAAEREREKRRISKEQAQQQKREAEARAAKESAALHRKIEQERVQAIRSDFFDAKRRAEIEEIKAFYHVDERKTALREAQEDFVRKQGLIARLSGQTRKAEEHAHAMRLNYEDMARRQQEAIDTINKKYHYQPPEQRRTAQNTSGEFDQHRAAIEAIGTLRKLEDRMPAKAQAPPEIGQLRADFSERVAQEQDNRPEAEKIGTLREDIREKLAHEQDNSVRTSGDNLEEGHEQGYSQENDIGLSR